MRKVAHRVFAEDTLRQGKGHAWARAKEQPDSHRLSIVSQQHTTAQGFERKDASGSAGNQGRRQRQMANDNPEPEQTLTRFVRKTLTALYHKGSPVWVGYYKRFKQRTFQFQGREYGYLYHVYNRTWNNERAVEVPIVWEAVKHLEPKKVLEVGNVLSHYYPVNHTITDKYEVEEGVINIDVIDYESSNEYDLIASISTLEHVGWDEAVKDPNKIPLAIENMRRLLTPRGRIMFTVPIGYNPYLDELIKTGKLPLSKEAFLKRVSLDNKWVEASWDAVKEAKYDEPYPCSNAIMIGDISC